MSDRTAGVKRDWCSRCNEWHYEGDLHLDEQIEKLESDLLAARNDLEAWQARWMELYQDDYVGTELVEACECSRRRWPIPSEGDK